MLKTGKLTGRKCSHDDGHECTDTGNNADNANADRQDWQWHFDSTSLVSPCNKTLGQIYLFNADPIKNIFGFKLEPL